MERSAFIDANLKELDPKFEPQELDRRFLSNRQTIMVDRGSRSRSSGVLSSDLRTRCPC